MGIFDKIKLKHIGGEVPVAHLAREKFRQNRWSIFAFVAFSAISTVIYVNNVHNINKLAEKVDKRQKLVNELKNANQVINHRLIQLQSPDRINNIAVMKLGMVKPEKAPVIIKESE